MSQVQILATDTETTGQGAEARICELAWVELDLDMNEVSRVSSLIDPECPISPGASGVHGITDDMVQDSPTIDEFFSEVLHPPLEADVILIAHKVDFDRARLEPIFNRYGTRVVTQLCTLRSARRHLKDAENHKLATLMYQYGLDRGESHRAAGDVQTLVSLLRYLLAVTGKSLTELIEEDGRVLIVERMPFGKWKDKPIKDVPKDYVEWALGPKGMDNLDPDLKATLEMRLRNEL